MENKNVGNSLDKQYLLLLAEIQNMGYYKGDRTGTGTLSLFGREIRHKMSEGFPLITSKKMYTKGVIVELIWFLNGGTNIQWLVKNGCNIWNGDAYKKYSKLAVQGDVLDSHYDPKTDTWHLFNMQEFVDKIKKDDAFAAKWGELGPIYGKQWRKWEKYGYRGVQNGAFDCGLITQEDVDRERYVDQIANLIHDLKNNPDSRRLMVNAWNVADIPDMTLPPCHYGFECWTRELNLEEREELAKGKTVPLLGSKEDSYDEAGIPKREISLRWIQRSCDFPLGIPFNIASYGFLLTMLAQQCNMVPGELIGSFGDCHIYQNQLEGVTQQLANPMFTLPELTLNKAASIFDYKLEDFTISHYINAGEVKYPLSN